VWTIHPIVTHLITIIVTTESLKVVLTLVVFLEVLMKLNEILLMVSMSFVRVVLVVMVFCSGFVWMLCTPAQIELFL
jgi:hypothetical protein